MSLADHPLDSAGRPLPDGSWPDTIGSAGALEPVRRFCNTINRENGADAWRSAAELQSWLAREGYPSAQLGRSDLRRLKEARDAVWACVTSQSLQPLAPICDVVELRLRVDDDGLRVHAGDRAANTVIADVVFGVLNAQHDGTWSRLKACEHCNWVFFDRSNNRSGRWCSMKACGGREKARTYRQRRAVR